MPWRRLIGLAASLLIVAVTWQVATHWHPGVPSRDLAGMGGISNPTSQPLHSATAPSASHRLSNTSATLAELAGSDHAILLENALIDTAQSVNLAIPPGLRAPSEPGAFIVQSRTLLDNRFRALLQSQAAALVAYIPNNACLIQASSLQARMIGQSELVRAVIPFEPYFKLKGPLLDLVLHSPDSAGSLSVKVLLFPGTESAILPSLDALGYRWPRAEPSPFGTVCTLQISPARLGSLAALPGVQEIEPAYARAAAMDLSRPTCGVAGNSTTRTNYLGLTGTNVVVCVADTGVDANHPDLLGRVYPDLPQSASDTNGHGTLVAGIIAGNGAQSPALAFAPGSVLPPVTGQFRGMAPGATLFAIGLDQSAHWPADASLQQAAATANAPISNDSWVYAGSFDYDLAAASYDAAVRDALPAVPGSQPVLFVFPAGNAGQDGRAGTIESPGTAKNVITVGAIEQFRQVTNQTWNCPGGLCATNQPWFSLTDSTNNEVAAFSGRGNVGIGVEGPSGRLKPDVVAPGTFVVSTRSMQWNSAAFYSPSNALNYVADTNFIAVWSNLDNSLGPNYRFDSGTSLACAEVSGVLALNEEFFQQRLARSVSPALLKALLINGANPIAGPVGLAPASGTNSPGWGLVQLPDSIPASLTNNQSFTKGIIFRDQNEVPPLATGQSHAQYLGVSDSARTQPLRLTLVWTDPPGNPAAALKLVNDLDLVVTNLDTGEVFWGNRFAPGTSFSVPFDADSPPQPDFVNNVECVYLRPPLATNYAVTVIGRKVNVNAVSTQADVVQDYALVLRAGDGLDTSALTLLPRSPVYPGSHTVSVLTNQFDSSSGLAGQIRPGERIGGQAPLATNRAPLFAGATNEFVTVGNSNQWRFYVFTNDLQFTNGAFLTFSPTSLSEAQMSLATLPGRVSASPEPDIDLYVSQDAGLLQLNPDTIAAAYKSVSRGGTETVLLTNAAPGPYFVGVKSESRLAAQFGIAALFAEEPFASPDANGNWIVRGLPLSTPIPAGSPGVPGQTYVFGLAPQDFQVRRVLVTNTLNHPIPSDLSAVLSHNGRSVALVNFSSNSVAAVPVLFDDSAEGDLPAARHTDGPGSLRDFGGGSAYGQWMLAVASTNQPGTNLLFSVCLEAQPDLGSSATITLAPGAAYESFLKVPPSATNLAFLVTSSAGQGPGLLSVTPVAQPSTVAARLEVPASASGLPLDLAPGSYPSLTPGLCSAKLVNLGPDTASYVLQATLSLDSPVSTAHYASAGSLNLLDDAVSSSVLVVTNPGSVTAASVSVRLDHPRVSDLAITLISPAGSRVLLSEDRGGDSTNGLGVSMLVTNVIPVGYSGGPEAVTNIIDTGQTSGVLAISYDFYSLPDTMHVYYEDKRIFDSGLVSGSSSVSLPYGPGASTLVTIIMNENGSSDTNTAWFYSVTSTGLTPVGVTFTEDTNLASVPMKFALPPFTNLSPAATGQGVFFLPEQSLEVLNGQSAAGVWTLEILDTRSGAVNPPPRLIEWQLDFALHQPDLPPVMTTLTNAIPLAVRQSATGSDSYRFVVSTNALRAQFEILSPSADLTLLARYGLPLPSLSSYDLSSTNPWTNEELIVCLSGGVPVPLLSGDWYLTVLNPGGGLVDYTVKATEWPATGTNIVITNQQVSGGTVCLSWSSLPGAHYYVQAAADLTTWTTISPSIMATGIVTTACVYFPPGSQFFAVREGLVLSSPLTLSSITSATSGLVLSWPAATPLDVPYRVEWSPSLYPPNWQSFTNLLHATNGACWFLDDGSQTSGFGNTRYYRLLRLPFVWP